MHKMLEIQRSMLEALQTFVTTVASQAEEGVKEGELSRAQIRKGNECHANQRGLQLPG